MDTSYLPQSDGWLPSFILLVGVTAIGNAIQTYLTTSYVRRLYPGTPPQKYALMVTETVTHYEDSTNQAEQRRPSVSSIATAGQDISPATPLSSRTFGTYTAVVGLIRIYAAYHLHEKAWYQLGALWTNIIGLTHFGLEILVFKTARFEGPTLVPMSVAVFGLIWSLAQYNHYVRAG